MDLTWSEFERTDMRVGTIIEVNDFPEARKPAYQLTIDFGAEIGIRKSSAQITKRYQKEDLVNRQIVAVVNFPKKTNREIYERMFGSWCCRRGGRRNFTSS